MKMYQEEPRDYFADEDTVAVPSATDENCNNVIKLAENLEPKVAAMLSKKVPETLERLLGSNEMKPWWRWVIR